MTGLEIFAIGLVMYILVGVGVFIHRSEADKELMEIEKKDYTTPYVDEDGTATVFVNGEPTRLKITIWSDEETMTIGGIER